MFVCLSHWSTRLPRGRGSRVRCAAWLALVWLVACGLGREPEVLAQRRGGRGTRAPRPRSSNDLGVIPRLPPRRLSDTSASPAGKPGGAGTPGGGGAAAGEFSVGEFSAGEGPQPLPEGARRGNHMLTLPIPQEARDSDLPQLSWRLPTPWPQYFQGLDHDFRVSYRNSAGDIRQVPATLCPSAPVERYRETVCRWKILSQTESLIVIEATINPGSGRVNSLRIQLDDQHRNLEVAVAAWEASSPPPPPTGPGESPETSPETAPNTAPGTAPAEPPPTDAADNSLWTPICDSGWLLDRTLPGHRLTRNRVPLSPCAPARVKIELSGKEIKDLKIASLRFAWDPQQTPGGPSEVAQLVRREERADAGETDWIFELADPDRAVSAAELEIDWGNSDYRPARLAIADSLEPGTPFRPIADGAVLNLPVGERTVRVQQVAFAPRLGRYLKWTVTNQHTSGELPVTGCRVTRTDAWVSIARNQLPNPPVAALTLTLRSGQSAIESRWGDASQAATCEPVADLPRFTSSDEFTPVTQEDYLPGGRLGPPANSSAFDPRGIFLLLGLLVVGGTLIRRWFKHARRSGTSPPSPQPPAE